MNAPQTDYKSQASIVNDILRLFSNWPSELLDKPAFYRSRYDYSRTAEEFEAGVKYCVDQGWLEESDKGWSKTPSGLAEFQRFAEQQREIEAEERARGEVWFNGFGLTLRSKRWAQPLGWLTFVFLMTLVFGLPLWAILRLP